MFLETRDNAISSLYKDFKKQGSTQPMTEDLSGNNLYIPNTNAKLILISQDPVSSTDKNPVLTNQGCIQRQ